ncbi:hypothetical protein [Paenibacillus tundrae]|uniref:hypothetical protein n=1 Tax=Paenibacillus tundrae TaxID=528187 RepID=UPI0022A93CA9|nr:hypothetical protein [Paenibacillus tundrae]MCZ1269016.1 hypothetical protein [Paenibacillus tundrae]
MSQDAIPDYQGSQAKALEAVKALSEFLNTANILEAHGTNPEGWGTDQSQQSEQAQPGIPRNRLYDSRIGTALAEKQCRTPAKES